ncbi:lectin-like [Momordica charantia]|uniref:Lectin-like n=1 Tax=Momordica charantia TaxID=3673 RepID=A0A6J1CLI9_MOMCH|nr:lectin-like [Momordica charantia]
MGSGWSEEQAAQSQPPPPATGSAASHGGAKVAEVKQLGHGLEAILKDADSAVDRSSMDKLHDQLHAGIFLNKRTKKYWMDKKSNSNCFMLFPRALSITWSEESKYWKWKAMEESSNPIEAIELVNVCWLEIHGKIKASELSPGAWYEAAFVVMIKDPAYGWDVPVNIRLKRPDGSKQERKEDMEEKPRGRCDYFFFAYFLLFFCSFFIHLSLFLVLYYRSL